MAVFSITAFEFRAINRVTIAIDYENNAGRWWSAAFDAREGAPESCRPLLLGATHVDEVTVSAEVAAAFRTWGAALPGWSDGPSHAREPVTFHDV